MNPQIDLHGAEVLHLPDQAAPITIGPSSIVGLVGAAPDAQGATIARLVVGAGNAALTFTAADGGQRGNTISLEIVRPAEASQPLTVSRDGRAITVSLAANGDGEATTTGAELVAAFAAVAAASARELVSVANTGTSTGADVVSPIALTQLAGGADEPFPLNVPTRVANAAAAVQLGTSGSLPEAVADVWRTAGRAGATIVVVRVADDTAASIIGSRGGQAATAASLAVGAGDAALTFTADAVGAGGNAITVALVDPNGNDGVLGVAVNGNAITVNLATDGGAAITSSAALVAAAVNGDAAASNLVTAAAGGDGSAVVAAAPVAPLSGGLAAIPAGTGIYALLNAEAETELKPRLIAAPALETTAAALALEAVADELRGIPVVNLDGATYSDAVAARRSLAHVYTVWPKFRVFEAAAGSVVDRSAAALTVGHIVRVDNEENFSASPSNRQLQDVVGTTPSIDWQIDSRNSTANLLSRAYIATAIRRGGAMRLWGNRLADGELITHRRVRHLIGDALLAFIADYIDRDVDIPFVEFILNRMNSHLRSETLRGIVLGGRAWFDAAYNTPDSVAANRVTFSFDLGLKNLAEHLTFRQSVSGIYNERIIAELTGTGA